MPLGPISRQAIHVLIAGLGSSLFPSCHRRPTKDDDILWESKATGRHQRDPSHHLAALAPFPPESPPTPLSSSPPSLPLPTPPSATAPEEGVFEELSSQQTTWTPSNNAHHARLPVPHRLLLARLSAHAPQRRDEAVLRGAYRVLGAAVDVAADTRSGLRDLDVGDGCGCAPVAPCSWASRKVGARVRCAAHLRPFLTFAPHVCTILRLMRCARCPLFLAGGLYIVHFDPSLFLGVTCAYLSHIRTRYSSVLLLGLAKRCSDYWEYMVHHVVGQLVLPHHPRHRRLCEHGRARSVARGASPPPSPYLSFFLFFLPFPHVFFFSRRFLPFVFLSFFSSHVLPFSRSNSRFFFFLSSFLFSISRSISPYLSFLPMSFIFFHVFLFSRLIYISPFLSSFLPMSSFSRVRFLLSPFWPSSFSRSFLPAISRHRHRVTRDASRAKPLSGPRAGCG
ncbi:hypothetical protein C8F04DRAFT_1400724, partial [Mycena alexandri]